VRFSRIAKFPWIKLSFLDFSLFLLALNFWHLLNISFLLSRFENRTITGGCWFFLVSDVFWWDWVPELRSVWNVEISLPFNGTFNTLATFRTTSIVFSFLEQGIPWISRFSLRPYSSSSFNCLSVAVCWIAICPILLFKQLISSIEFWFCLLSVFNFLKNRHPRTRLAALI